jgi:hypothetical protein
MPKPAMRQEARRAIHSRTESPSCALKRAWFRHGVPTSCPESVRGRYAPSYGQCG